MRGISDISRLEPLLFTLAEQEVNRNKVRRKVRYGKKELLDKIKQTVLEIEPNAEVKFYGSRSRGEGGMDSDWDFLVLLDGEVDDERTDNISGRCQDTFRLFS